MYVDWEVANKLKGYGQNVFTVPTSATQDDWLTHSYKLKTLNVNNGATFTLTHNAVLEVENLNANNATINLGSKRVWIDSKDGENVKSRLYGGNVESSSYGDGKAYGVGEDMEFNQNLTQGYSNTIENVRFKGDLNLVKSRANLTSMEFVRNIKADNMSPITLSNSTFQGDVQTQGTLTLHSSLVHGKINTHTLNANNTTFIVDVDLASKQAKNVIEASASVSGNANILMLNLLQTPTDTSVDNILLASLKDTNKTLTQNYFDTPNVKYGFSVYKPNVTFNRDKDNKAQWQLSKLEKTNSYFDVSDNNPAINQGNGLFNQVLLSYLIEWNNIQKRMGELRDNPSAYGAWIRTFGGSNSDGSYKR
ncbi:serine protease [Helicobacter trogontum]|uniref:Serine protease n=1 Tax=Helicobacter trogontum TaxID=50960 RepID=A0A4U8TFJ5_9HELI|nr:hypothetical protein [Helicobacter trogontum]TLD98869.1 serine protease [Helicobacter trogontum]